MDKHEIIADIKRVASELGHHPTRREYLEKGKTKHAYEQAFGLWTEAIKAAFGEPTSYQKSSAKIVTEFYSKKVADLLKNSSSPQASLIDGFTPTVCIPDVHFPWANLDALSALYAWIEILKPERIIQMGDLYDMYSFAKFPRSRMIISVEDEVLTSRSMAEAMWSTIRKIAPDAHLVQLLGNHCIRSHKRVLETNCPELEVFFDFKSIFNFEGVETIYDPRELVIYDGINFTHGHLKHGAHRALFKTHVVHGHTHAGKLTGSNIDGSYLFELDCGLMGNPNAPCFGYMPKKITGWQTGFGYISALGPIFIKL